MNRFISYLFLLAILFVFYKPVQCQTIAVINNSLQVYNGDNVTITTTNLQSTVNGIVEPRVIYTVTSVTNARFLRYNTTFGFYLDTNTFSVADVTNGLILFSHFGNQELPTFTLNVYDPFYNISTTAIGNIEFTAFRRGTIGAPRPGFFASVDPTTLIVTLRIRMYLRVFSPPEVKFNIGLSALTACQQTDLIRDGFVYNAGTSTYWYSDYVLSLPLSSYLSNPNVQQISTGGVIDLVALMYAEYMITTYTPLPSTSTGGDVYVAPPISGTCYKVIYQQRYILTLVLQVTRVSFNTTGGITTGGNNCTAYIQPKRIFVNDLGKLEIRMIVWTLLAPPVTSWTVTGPYFFNVTDAIFTGTANGYYQYTIVMQSNVINGPIDFYGDYVLTYLSPDGSGCTISYSLQYVVPYPVITQVLQYNTTAQTYGNAALTIAQTQFAATDTIYVRVDVPGAPSVPYMTISPYNVIMCCFLDFTTIPVNVDCRNASNSDFSTQIYINGVPQSTGGLNAATLPPPSTSSYGFQFDLPFAIRDGLDRRCFLTIESAYLPTNTTTVRSLFKEENVETRSLAANPVANTVVSLTYRLFDIVPKSTKGGAGAGGVVSGAFSIVRGGGNMWILSLTLVLIKLFIL
ncbi:predicted protein [Naegleria gruberi]|uniref:Predicted protein n=1 Tax=Naegleria gruberi TaxID=5762 RepID=D2VRZ0_NAEGR|nr:uncharacterized protein NAEGRDRAFT_51787 [Naegleria gruberi]EFC40473.1 predicted protein [Naegleria gruberi]|eukprot:XP_002673217.1 predicted protein [Naegleria gruberi strain NEG-M]